MNVRIKFTSIIILTLFIAGIFSTPALAAVSCDDTAGDCVDDLNSIFGSRGTSGSQTGLPTSATAFDIIVQIVNFLLGIVALLALLVIIIGSISYILSIGDEQKAARAKKIIIYAVAGLVLSIISFYLIGLVRTILLTP